MTSLLKKLQYFTSAHRTEVLRMHSKALDPWLSSTFPVSLHTLLPLLVSHHLASAPHFRQACLFRSLKHVISLPGFSHLRRWYNENSESRSIAIAIGVRMPGA